MRGLLNRLVLACGGSALLLSALVMTRSRWPGLPTTWWGHLPGLSALWRWTPDLAETVQWYRGLPWTPGPWLSAGVGMGALMVLVLQPHWNPKYRRAGQRGRLAVDAFTDAVASDLRDADDQVLHARARLRTRRRPLLELRLVVTPDVNVPRLLSRIETDILHRARTTLGNDRLRAEVQIRARHHRRRLR